MTQQTNNPNSKKKTTTLRGDSEKKDQNMTIKIRTLNRAFYIPIPILIPIHVRVRVRIFVSLIVFFSSFVRTLHRNLGLTPTPTPTPTPSRVPVLTPQVWHIILKMTSSNKKKKKKKRNTNNNSNSNTAGHNNNLTRRMSPNKRHATWEKGRSAVSRRTPELPSHGSGGDLRMIPSTPWALLFFILFQNFISNQSSFSERSKHWADMADTYYIVDLIYIFRA